MVMVQKNNHLKNKVEDLFVQIIIHFSYLQMWAEFKLVIFYLHDLADEFHYYL